VRRIEVHGHRGARALRPENTLPAFEYAIAAGVDAIEMDVAVTRDNVVVVSHDPVLEGPLLLGPVSKSGPARAVIRESTFEQVRQWDCGSVRHPDFPRQVAVPGARVPSLEEVFRLAGTFRFNVEIKSFPEHPDLAPVPAEFARLVVESIRKHGVEARVMVQSFDFRVLHEVKKLAPGIPLAALFEDDRDFLETAKEAAATIVGPLHTLVTEEKVIQLHTAGIGAMPWTANTEADWERLLKAGVHGIITDDPAGLIAYLNRISRAQSAFK
jgi:glycerophosphoryl diester phosphodiesterase